MESMLTMGSLNKALHVLEAVAADARGATAKEISTALGLPVATTYRLLAALGDAGYVVHRKSEGRYVLGYQLHRLGGALHRQMGTSRTVARLVANLHETAGAAAYYAVHWGNEVVVAHVADSPEHPRIPVPQSGFAGALHATAFGKILLAGLPEPEQRRFLRRFGMAARTPRTITDEEELIAQVRRVAREGLATEIEEYLSGTSCMAVAVCNGNGQTVGSVAVSVPASADLVRTGGLGLLLRGTAHEISMVLRSVPGLYGR
ncbi:IclR family transcriptional regulator [Arthrobacter sp. zg-Y820]|uniref:IclR family transcriptional regulator n=1 Tax=unclassified Arthrobacter TaxID=235627 RepID=UPI001E5169DF|nr:MULTISPECIES: IclR family transcriptional regulator [unclassified Arthrobacter]MCC9195283.1 IclR family transcriptional regulator [Arthrobacter sp. zg-Y820]MDK1278142.1 IclR family transcriptional regulator [Arthrobacter sp. zg.Y820]WIB10031.1 IclR family transcriptional regulator [Arthrobacter sp. zg-Y820]